MVLEEHLTIYIVFFLEIFKKIEKRSMKFILLGRVY